MQKKQRKTLPKTLPGSVQPQFVRCGRPACHCANGALHGPYYYRFWWEGGRLCKAYIKRAELEQARALCLAGRVQRKQERELSRQMEQKAGRWSNKAGRVGGG